MTAWSCAERSHGRGIITGGSKAGSGGSGGSRKNEGLADASYTMSAIYALASELAALH